MTSPGDKELGTAVAAARKFAKDLIQQGMLAADTISLEEFERNGPVWHITLGFRGPSPFESLGSPLAGLQRRTPDFYKLFIVNNVGEVQAMKNREP